MGLFSKIFGKKDSAEVQEQESQEEVKPVVIDMSKHQENLNTVVINMSKDSKIDMSKHKAKVKLAMDYSGSMTEMYRNGEVQNIITRLLPIALRFDDDGELENYIFSNSCKRRPSVMEQNYKNYVKDYLTKLETGMYMGGTQYAPVLYEIIGKKILDSKIPTFVIFITDGENSDRKEAEEAIRFLSPLNIFIQFVGIGNEKFEFLKKLDTLEGRKSDNTGFIEVKDMNKMTDEELYTELLRQYKDWLNKR